MPELRSPSRPALGEVRTIGRHRYLATSYVEGRGGERLVLWSWMPPDATPEDLGRTYEAARWSPVEGWRTPPPEEPATVWCGGAKEDPA